MGSTSVFLNVNNIAKSLEFYRALGFTVAKEYKGDDGVTTYADLELDGSELSLGHIGANDDADFREWVSTPLGAGVVISFEVADVDAVFAKAKNAGGEIESPPGDRPYGRAFYMADNDGYSLSFWKKS